MKSDVMAVVGRKNPILTAIALPVVVSDSTRPQLERLAIRMLATVRAKRGLAIAAPQVGVNQRVVVTWDGVVWINPSLELDADELREDVEGCLSIPGRVYEVTRPTRCALTATDLEGTEVTVDLEGLEARLAQHELDHLDGILISDRGREVANGGTAAMKF